MLVIHIAAGIIVLVFASIAISVKKGENIHRAAGNTFFVSMLIVSVSAIYLDVIKNEVPVIGVLVLYLVATSWGTIKRKEGTVGIFEKLAFVVIVLVAIGLFSIGWQAMNSEDGTSNGVPGAVFYAFGSIALFAAFLDLVMILRGGVSGKHRIARHVWRMCIPTIFALMSVLSQKSVIPESLHGSSLLWIPVLLLLVLTFFWLIRVLFTKWIQNNEKAIRNI
jgi:uncharacterized membrane protein